MGEEALFVETCSSRRAGSDVAELSQTVMCLCRFVIITSR